MTSKAEAKGFCGSAPMHAHPCAVCYGQRHTLTIVIEESRLSYWNHPERVLCSASATCSLAQMGLKPLKQGKSSYPKANALGLNGLGL